MGLETEVVMTRLREEAARRELARISSESVRVHAEREVHLAVAEMLEAGEVERSIECFSHTLVVQLEL